MNKLSIYFSVLALFSFALFFYVMTVKTPEQQRIVSDDNILSVDGFFIGDNVSVEKIADWQYLVTPISVMPNQTAILSFDLSSWPEEKSPPAIYYFDDQISMWELILSPNDIRGDIAIIQRNKLGKFAVHQYMDIKAPDFISQYDALLKMAPKNTVAYQFDTGFNAGDDFFIKIANDEQKGGCGGIFLKGNKMQKSELQNTAHVLLNDIQSEVLFVYRAIWYVGDGCENGEISPLE
ncbi:hypothetical protein D6827_03020 [Candidatus Parcubacteria bacterium]|nr:MAG: hypothetical protein D6827_03020 [Candidatus Parcubacteria bacterium]